VYSAPKGTHHQQRLKSQWDAQDLSKFRGQFKKFFPKEQEIIRTEIRKILASPLTGQVKKGSLVGVRVHKFKIHHQLYLLAYEPDAKANIVYLYALDTHEGFYEALQRYLH